MAGIDQLATSIRPLPPEPSRVKTPKKISRREFLKIAGGATGGIALAYGANKANQLLGFVGGKEGKLITFPPRVDSLPAQQSESPEDGRSRVLEQKLSTFEAIVSVFKDPAQGEDVKEYLAKRFNLSESNLVTLVDSSTSSLPAGDIGTIMRIYSTNGGSLPPEVNALFNHPASEDFSGLLSYVMKNSSNREWKQFILDKKLEKPLLTLGSNGRRVLLHAGIDINDFELQKQLTPSADDSARLPSHNGIMLIDRKADIPNTVVSIVSNEKKQIYQFAPETKPLMAKHATFILNQVNTIAGAPEGELAKLHIREFELFQAWVFEQYRQVAAEVSETSSPDFFNKRLFEEKGFSTDEINKVPQRMNFLVESFAKGNIGPSLAKHLVAQAAAGDVEAFNHLYESVEPGAHSIFNARSSRTVEARSYQSLLRAAAASGKITQESLLEAAQIYSGNLFLLPITDRISVDGQKKEEIIKQNDLTKPELVRRLLSDELSLDAFAAEIFGQRKTLVCDPSGNPIGTIIAGRVSEPVCEAPKAVIDILKATEGVPWDSGKHYLQKFIGRNFKASIPFFHTPNSGGSDPTMQLMKQLLPSQFDQGTIGGEYGVHVGYDTKTGQRYEYGGQEAVLHRPDKYSLGYVDRLYNAIADGTNVGELYELPEPNSVQKTISSNDKIAQICAKLENYIVTRDFQNKFGVDKMMQLYAQYVPMGNTREGIQIHGFEAGSQYYFGKNLKELNNGEIAILVGMIQAPATYSPQKYVGTLEDQRVASEQKQSLTKAFAPFPEKLFGKNQFGESGSLFVSKATTIPLGPPEYIDQASTWVKDTTETINRALTVARLAADNSTFNQDQLNTQIRSARFSLQTPLSWKSMNEAQLNKLAQGTLTRSGVPLGNGLAVLKEPDTNEMISPFPSVVSLDNLRNRRQEQFESTLEGLIDKDQLKLSTRENSVVSNTILSFWEVITKAQGDQTPPQELISRVRQWCKENGINADAPTLKPHMDVFRQVQIWQCGQSALLLNAILQQKLGIDTVPFSSVEGGVKNWVKALGKTDEIHQYGYMMKSVDNLINRRIGYDDETMLKNDVASQFEVGDMIVSWRSMKSEDYKDPGHVCHVLDKGKDSFGRTYLKIIDTNFQQNGYARVQVVWSNSLGDLIFPGQRIHSAIIRSDKSINHGNQSDAKDDMFGRQILFATVEGKKVTVPGAIQSAMGADGKSVEVINPGFAAATFNKDGFVASVDKTRLLEGSAVNPGSALRPFIFAYLRANNIINWYSTFDKNLSYFPRNDLALDGSDTMVTNTSTLMMNLSIDDNYRVSWREALAAGFDVPFQHVMKDLIQKDPSHWLRFQEFLGKFGMELRDNRGNILQKPTPLVALGRDTYIKSLDSLGYGLSLLLNPEANFNERTDADLIAIAQETRTLLLDDVGGHALRRFVDVRGVHPIEDEVGHDLFKASVMNGITSVTFNGDKAVWSGTNLGGESSGFVITPDTNGGYMVTVSRTLGGDMRPSSRTDYLSNISLQLRKALGAGVLGYPAITADLATAQYQN